MSLLANRLELPLFLFSRNPIKRTRITELKDYIKSKAEQYTLKCIEDNAQITAAHKRMLSVTGLDKVPMQTECPASLKRTGKRFMVPKNDWSLPPNIYDTLYEPYSRLKGAGGAHWPKKNFEKMREKNKIEWDTAFKYYKLPTMMDKWRSRSGYFRGKLLRDPRNFRPASRMCLESPDMAYRDPDEPSPATYDVGHHEIRNNLTQVKEAKPGKAYRFYRRTTVQLTDRFSDIKREPNLAAPGRYEMRYAKVCVCSPKLIYRPYLYMAIDEQKRNKFRRKKWSKIRRKLYCDPNLSHVPGHGFTYLFQLTAKQKRQLREERLLAKKSGKKKKEFSEKQLMGQLKMYSDAKYLDLINRTDRRVDNHWIRLPVKKRVIKYDSIIKQGVKKKSKVAKNIGFSSGAPRFEDIQKPPSLTQLQVTEIINSLPERLRVVNKPVTMKPIKEIKPRYLDLKEIQENKLKKGQFVFPPLPGTVLLFGDSAVRVSKESASPFYKSKMVPEQFFRKK